jgi:rhodanese-related sulfurtransferase
MKEVFSGKKIGSRFSRGMVAGIVMALAIVSASGAIAGEFKSWRSGNGEVVARASNDYLQQGNPASTTFSALCPLIAPPAKLLTALNMAAAGDKSQLGLIVDVRPQSEYLAGHIPGAVWIADWFDMAKPENLDKLDVALAAHLLDGGANKIIVYCHTGHKGGYVAGVLGALGYSAHNLKFGYKIGWQRDLSALYSKTEGILPTAGPVETTTANIIGSPKNPAELHQMMLDAQANPAPDQE